MSAAHTLAVLVENKPGVLARVAGLIARRGFNITSLAVGETEHPEVSRMTIVLAVDGKPVEQCIKQLHKLIPVLRVEELPVDASVEREIALVKVGVGVGRRAEVLEIVEIFRAKVVDVDADVVVVEVTGSPEKVQALENLLEPYGIVELARTGRIALKRGGRGLKAPILRQVPIKTAS
ncbi:MAG: acetolactate synthase small subunit [Actinomycetota bacterium]|nr:acetolactate synthase small subunit [Actinomycetota bacterium]